MIEIDNLLKSIEGDLMNDSQICSKAILKLRQLKTKQKKKQSIGKKLPKGSFFLYAEYVINLIGVIP